MADIEKISVSGTSYDVRDASAAHALTDIAVAGNNIEFQSGPFPAYTKVGTPTINSNNELTYTNSSSYLYAPGILNKASESFEIVTAYYRAGSYNYIPILGSTTGTTQAVYMQFNSGKINCYISSNGSYGNIGVLSSTNQLTNNAKTFIKVTYDSTNGYALYFSSDGETWNLEASLASTTRVFQSDFDLSFGWYAGSSSPAVAGGAKIYLADTYINVNNGQYTWSAIENSTRQKINATGLPTYPSANGTYVPVLTITSGVPSIAWVAYTP